MRPGQYADKKRDLRKQKGKSITTFPSKRKIPFLTESPLEADFCYHLDYDLDVISYEPQPLGFYYLFEGKVCLYTPDFLVHDKTGFHYYEVKYKKYTQSKYFSSGRFDACVEQARALGKSLSIITEDYIYQKPKYNNLNVLHQYFGMQDIPSEFINKLKTELLSGNKKIESLLDIEDRGCQLGYIYQLIAEGFIKTDIQNKELSIDAVVSMGGV
ncbi:Tn7 transposase TnsA N-terminal domain-containing protein [uncultured Endozoicomonas sp.]|uniref:Tn7 transposase TnsA N-terminal domain-containing protein n=1 Tax=uncultured Endozoicomonas sp. TaxID=432652 RepID=UPI00262C19F5|nr:Tn7 transposase TnsA N-terminal domain-containing protein [uncultured Endozoicomonas sp.]